MRRWLRARELDVDVSDRRASSRQSRLPTWRSANGRERLVPVIGERKTPWRSVELTPPAAPGMLTDEERRYYRWLGRFYDGSGEIVELGCWLGCSTVEILRGLMDNPNFVGRRLHVFDAFVWDSYMTAWYDASLEPGMSFRPVFDRFTASVSEFLTVEACAIAPAAGLSPLRWRGGPITLCWVDCGKSRAMNEAWFEALAPFFVPDRTLVVMQDWGAHRSGRAEESGAKEFTDARSSELALVHELREGDVATFLFRESELRRVPDDALSRRRS